MIQIFLLLILFGAFFSALLLAVTSFAKSFKEAQVYLIPIIILLQDIFLFHWVHLPIFSLDHYLMQVGNNAFPTSYTSNQKHVTGSQLIYDLIIKPLF